MRFTTRIVGVSPTLAAAGEVPVNAKVTFASGSTMLMFLEVGLPVVPGGDVMDTVQMPGVAVAWTTIGWLVAPSAKVSVPDSGVQLPVEVVTLKLTSTTPAVPLLRATNTAVVPELLFVANCAGARTLNTPGLVVAGPQVTTTLPLGFTLKSAYVSQITAPVLSFTVWEVAGPMTIKAAIAPAVAAVRRRRVWSEVMKGPFRLWSVRLWSTSGARKFFSIPVYTDTS